MVSMGLVLFREQHDALFAQAAAAAPRECCGILAGQVEGGGTLVREVHPVDNVSEADPTTSFLLDPRAHLRLQRVCRGRGLAIVGFYHSHPAGSAVPSAADLEQAWPHASYVIVALRAGRPFELRSWRLDEGGGRFYEEPVEVISGSGGAGGFA